MADESLPQQLARQIRRDILRGKLVPGAPIKERDSASELGVSRTPMREAIRILAQEGLVYLRPSRSPIVAAPSIKEVVDQVELLILLETRSAELVCQFASDREIASIADIVRLMSERFDATDPLDMFEVDMSFHSAIAKASHNAPIAETHQRYLQRVWRARYMAAVQKRNRDKVVCEHREIADALAERDTAAAAHTIHGHLSHLVSDIRNALEAENAEQTGKARKSGRPE
ncbi:GntR family transcriptional regulator [Tropicimonas sp. IMCC6043]|uniref:GntR family transcriptional regulator n=1 Tax=Tropicimonas sp. IMCC6043 TaxID=2510645 RepID=UPI00101DB593|nr:GntR family transcriptional regulator [Tropicimonas sp. IMCC6043]RYH11708.1 GntR family transcriptional regulator [Tropicimonas sp. IMCC6043]